MVHKLVNIIQSFKSQSLCIVHFCGLRGRQTQGPPRAVHTLATPLVYFDFRCNASHTWTNTVSPAPALLYISSFNRKSKFA